MAVSRLFINISYWVFTWYVPYYDRDTLIIAQNTLIAPNLHTQSNDKFSHFILMENRKNALFRLFANILAVIGMYTFICPGFNNIGQITPDKRTF